MRTHARFTLLALALVCAGCPGPVATSDAGAELLDVAIADAPPTDVRTGMCVGDDECSDGSFCNGIERCEPAAVGADARGCAPSRGEPCLAVQACNEETDTCVTDCGADRDADDDGVDAANCPGGTDCDDADPLRHPGLSEVCDAEDHDEDCDDTTFGERDLDRDGAFDVRCCNEDAAGVRACGDDCNDAARGLRPLGVEICNGLDDDCNGIVDEGVTVVVYPDVDRDLHGDEALSVMACLGAVGVSPYDDDCDDTASSAHGAQVEICDGLDNDCDDRVDENARPVTWYRDLDGDGFGAAASGTMVSCAPLVGYSLLPTDCDDTNRSRSPLGVESCNGLDDDCNGLPDFAVGVNDREDDDADGHPDAACGGDDCDDGDPSAYPGAPEICDFRDSDCDRVADLGATPPPGATADVTVEIDWYPDVDQDGWGASTGAVRSCERQPGRVTRAGDCADADASRHPGAVDRCDGVDDDCDGGVDEDASALAFYADGDGDGDGDGPPTLACSLPPGLVGLPGDCAPADPLRAPGAIETCNTIDDDCDGVVDELLFRDADGDGHGDPSMPSGATCAPGDVGSSDDCDDGDPLVGGASTCVEICNGRDDDGDGIADEPGAEASCPNADTTMWACAAGRCEVVGCRGMAEDCDAVAGNGCETDTATDPRACGDCTTACGVGAECTAGSCSDPVVDVACGWASTMALRRSGNAVYWGEGGAVSATTSGRTPIPALSDVTGASELELGPYRGCALSTGGHRCWGAVGTSYFGGAYSLLGDAVVADVAVPTSLAAGPFAELALGMGHACGRRASGQVLCWGGAVGRPFPALGDGTGLASTTPVSVLGLADSASIAAGHSHTCAVRTNGHVVCWGENTNGALGTGGFLARPFPLDEVRLESGLPLTGVAEVAIGMSYIINWPHTCARRTDGTVWCWGVNTDNSGSYVGALGIDEGMSTNDFRPHAVNVVSGPGSTTPLAGVVRIEAGSQFTCAELDSGALVCWGRNDAGQLGIGTTTSAPAPVPLALPPFTDFCVGVEHACALLVDGRVLCWGRNTSGEAGQDGPAMVLTPTEVAGLRWGPP